MTLMRRFRSAAETDFVTSATLEHVGSHEHLSVWVRHALVGTLILAPGHGTQLAWLLGLNETMQESEPPGEIEGAPISWAPRGPAAPFSELAIAVQVAERPHIAAWAWRCAHGNVLRDHTGLSFEPECGCRAPSLRGGPMSGGGT